MYDMPYTPICPAYRHINALNVYLHCWNIHVSSEKFTFLISKTKHLFLCLFACLFLMVVWALWALSKCTRWRTRFLFDLTRSSWYNDLWRSHALLATKSLQQGKAINHLWYNEAQQISQGTTYTSAGNLSWSVFPSKDVTC